MRRKSSTFLQLIALLNRCKFKEITQEYAGDYYTKSFSSWQHLRCLLYGVITSQSSLRTLEMNYNEEPFTEPLKQIRRSTLSDANGRRNPALYLKYFDYLVEQFHIKRQDKREINQLVRLIDSTPTMLLGRGHEWVEKTQRIKGLKIHVTYNPGKKAPTYFTISSAKVNDIIEAQRLILEAGYIYVFDRAYYDFQWWNSFNAKGCYFVTRAKSTLKYAWVKQHSQGEGAIKSDSLIELTSQKGCRKYSGQLRQVKARVEVRGKIKVICLLTNNFSMSSAEVVDLYKQRWQIELFFKWLKQHLRIKKFYGENENSIKLQIIIAMIAYLLIHRLKEVLGIQASLHTLTHWLQCHIDKNILKSVLVKPPDEFTKRRL